MGRKYTIRNQEEFYFLTFTAVYWLDIFIRQEYKNICTSISVSLRLGEVKAAFGLN